MALVALRMMGPCPGRHPFSPGHPNETRRWTSSPSQKAGIFSPVASRLAPLLDSFPFPRLAASRVLGNHTAHRRLSVPSPDDALTPEHISRVFHGGLRNVHLFSYLPLLTSSFPPSPSLPFRILQVALRRTGSPQSSDSPSFSPRPRLRGPPGIARPETHPLPRFVTSAVAFGPDLFLRLSDPRVIA